ncbi:MAG: phosphoesterase [Thermoplasmata archaeon]|nr:MAG: phosphoesterase [Thermoplasmata archaeon]
MQEVEIWTDIFASQLHCLYAEKQNAAVIADLHLGYEGVLRMQGIMIPNYQKEVIKERLKKIMEKYEPESIIVNGDFKHEFGKNLRQEWREVGEMLEFLSQKSNVFLIKGNHDNFLKTIASKYNIPVKMQMEMDGITIAHGHVEIKGKKIIMAHEHPSIHIRDKVGASLRLPCYMVSQSIIVMPAFSPLATGTDVSSTDAKEYLSPILQNEDVSAFHIWAISEIGLLDFSTIKQLKMARI